MCVTYRSVSTWLWRTPKQQCWTSGDRWKEDTLQEKPQAQEFYFLSSATWRLFCIYLFIQQKSTVKWSLLHRLTLASCHEAVKLLSGVFSLCLCSVMEFSTACFSICACLKAIYLDSFVIWSDCLSGWILQCVLKVASFSYKCHNQNVNFLPGCKMIFRQLPYVKWYYFFLYLYLAMCSDTFTQYVFAKFLSCQLCWSELL